MDFILQPRFFLPVPNGTFGRVVSFSINGKKKRKKYFKIELCHGFVVKYEQNGDLFNINTKYTRPIPQLGVKIIEKKIIHQLIDIVSDEIGNLYDYL